jgi:peroxiredoxin
MINHITLLLFVLLSVRGVFAGFPDTIKDIDGVVLDLKQLTSQKRLAVITLKTAECPVCQQQLIRIKEKLSELIVCNITFIVLSPGSIDKIQKAKSKTQFPYPFIEDEDLAISKSLNLNIDENQILPTILILNNKLEIEWEQRGRNAFYFGDPKLMEILDCSSWI